MDNLIIFCADVGSIKSKKFGWAAFVPGELKCRLGDDIEEFARLISEFYKDGYKIALGFECPMFVPVRKDPVSVNSARAGEGNRSWSAGAGTGSLATGLVEYLWVFNCVSEILGSPPQIEFDWNSFLSSKTVFVWEAFVSSASKGEGHAEDAAIAVECFRKALPDLTSANAIQEDFVFSLAGAAALKAGWSNDIEILSKSCLVIKS